jgi:pimeloyl-ACP methyl ester carboxylesterase
MKCHHVALAALVAMVIAAASRPEAQAAMDLHRVTRKVRVASLEFPVVDYGEGAPVLLLHGFPDDRHLWRHQVPVLAAAGLRVIAPDLRGFGDAPRPTDPAEYGLAIAGRDVIGILDALRIREVQLVGHDWGAALGWHLAAQHPDRIQRFVALSVGAPGGAISIEQREKSWYIAFFRQAGAAEEQLQRDDWKLFREWLRNTADTDRYIASLSRPGALTAALNWYRASNAPAGGGAPARVTCPVMGIWSDGDAYLTEERLRTSGERINGSFRYERITGASHWMMLDKPADVNRLLLDFLLREI